MTADSAWKPMPKVLIAYASDHGTTRLVAQAIAAGASELEGCRADARDVELLDADDLRQVDALVLGSPVHMGSCHWAMKQFIDRLLGPVWPLGLLEGRVGALFATGAGRGGGGAGAELNMLSMLAVLAELGLIFVPLPRSVTGFDDAGLHWGPYYRTALLDGRPALEAEDMGTAREHGRHIAGACLRLGASSIFSHLPVTTTHPNNRRKTP